MFMSVRMHSAAMDSQRAYFFDVVLQGERRDRQLEREASQSTISNLSARLADANAQLAALAGRALPPELSDEPLTQPPSVTEADNKAAEFIRSQRGIRG